MRIYKVTFAYTCQDTVKPVQDFVRDSRHDQGGHAEGCWTRQWRSFGCGCIISIEQHAQSIYFTRYKPRYVHCVSCYRLDSDLGRLWRCYVQNTAPGIN